MKLQVLLVLIRMRVVTKLFCDTHRETAWSSQLDRLIEGVYVWRRESHSERETEYIGVCYRKGALWALKSSGHGAPCCSARESEAHGAQEPAGLVSGPTHSFLDFSLPSG